MSSPSVRRANTQHAYNRCLRELGPEHPDTLAAWRAAQEAWTPARWKVPYPIALVPDGGEPPPDSRAELPESLRSILKEVHDDDPHRSEEPPVQ